MDVARVYDKSGKDIGSKPQGWWLDPKDPAAFRYYDLDSIYPAQYFKVDHVFPAKAMAYADLVLARARMALDVKKIVEFGCGGGWFTEAFALHGSLRYIEAIEGTSEGYARARKKVYDIPCVKVKNLDMRHPISPSGSFDLALCTEVAEHIEIPFSGTLVRSLTLAAPLILFSAYEPGKESHIHHCNERPPVFWEHLFSFFGYKRAQIADIIKSKLEDRGSDFYYDPSVLEKKKVEKAAGI